MDDPGVGEDEGEGGGRFSNRWREVSGSGDFWSATVVSALRAERTCFRTGSAPGYETPQTLDFYFTQYL